MGKEEIIEYIEQKIKESNEMLTHTKDSHQFYYYNGGMDALRMLRDILKEEKDDDL
jgi:hypothetical protein